MVAEMVRVREDHERTEAEIAADIRELPEAFLECRTIGHSWRLRYCGQLATADADVKAQARRSMYLPDGVRIMQCSRCRTRRLDFVNYRYGGAYRFLFRRYVYPDTYHVQGIHQHRVMLHEELFARHWEEAE